MWYTQRPCIQYKSIFSQPPTRISPSTNSYFPSHTPKIYGLQILYFPRHPPGFSPFTMSDFPSHSPRIHGLQILYFPRHPPGLSLSTMSAFPTHTPRIPGLQILYFPLPTSRLARHPPRIFHHTGPSLDCHCPKLVHLPKIWKSWSHSRIFHTQINFLLHTTQGFCNCKLPFPYTFLNMWGQPHSFHKKDATHPCLQAHLQMYVNTNFQCHGYTLCTMYVKQLQCTYIILTHSFISWTSTRQILLRP